MQGEPPAAMQGLREIEEARFQKPLAEATKNWQTGLKLIEICFLNH
jgi:hypothetical protein